MQIKTENPNRLWILVYWQMSLFTSGNNLTEQLLLKQVVVYSLKGGEEKLPKLLKFGIEENFKMTHKCLQKISSKNDSLYGFPQGYSPCSFKKSGRSR